MREDRVSWGNVVKVFRENQAMKEKDSDFFTVNELARHFRVNPKTIYRRLWAKQLPAFKVGRTWRIAKKDLIWLKR